MIMKDTKAIPCTIGILTYNSEKNLERAIQSIKECDEIILADGGSTDGTLEIGEKYDCRVINQSNPGYPITNFALERNRILDAAEHDLIFFLDADEIASTELIEKIREITLSDTKPTVYWVQYVRTDISGEKKYRTFRKTYQPRLFHRSTGARYARPVHERIMYNPGMPVVYVKEPWYVPIDLDFKEHKRKVHYRFGIQASQHTSKNLLFFLRLGLYYPLKEICKSLIRLIAVRCMYPRNGIPMRFELFRMYSHLVIVKLYARQYLRNL